MAAIIRQEITNAGGTFNFDAENMASGTIIELYTTAGVTLAADVNVVFTTKPGVGCSVFVMQDFVSTGAVDLNGNTFTINSRVYPQWTITTPFSSVLTTTVTGTTLFLNSFDLYGGGTLSGDSLTDASVALTKLVNLTSGRIIVGNASNIPTEVAMSGDATLANTGAMTIANSAITNAKVHASAAIARSKTAAGTADYVVINSNTGVMSEEAQLAPVRGGTGQDTSASTGFPVVAAGTWSVGAQTFIETVAVSFEAAGGVVPSVGDFKIKMSGTGTITGLYAIATKAIAGTDNGTIVAKNNAGTTMTNGTITFTASDARGTAYSVSPSANNTFVNNDIITLTTAKTTAGGWALVTITYTRTA